MSSQTAVVAGIQLDLKYHMYNKKFLGWLVDWLPGQGINTILLEYEDKFPYRKYPLLSAPDAFTPAELTAFLRRARGNGLRVIPLVQSLSHLEFALDHPELRHLAEGPGIPTQICPSNPEAVTFVLDLMREVLEYHAEDEFFHCGGDETWFLGTCAKCAAWKAEKGLIGMWAEHQRPILDFILGAGKRPIVWDDIFWKDFDSISRVGLPRETVLMCWNYNITSLQPKAKDGEDAEFGGAAKALKQVEIYQRAGHATLACPCCNYGQLFPRHSVSLGNTQAWAEKVAASGMLGLINSSWACFHVPLQTQLLYFSATAALLKDPQTQLNDSWHRAWAEGQFGVAVDGLDGAFEAIGALWELPMPDYGRNFTPVVYGYMNMVLHYPGRQEERRRRGAYHGNWEDIDFCAMYLKGVAEVKKNDPSVMYAKLDEHLAAYPRAVAVFRALARQAQRNRELAGLHLFLSEYKYLGLRVFSHLLRGGQDRAALLAELDAARPALAGCLAACFEPDGVKRLLRAWWEPLRQALLAGKD